MSDRNGSLRDFILRLIFENQEMRARITVLEDENEALKDSVNHLYSVNFDFDQELEELKEEVKKLKGG